MLVLGRLLELMGSVSQEKSDARPLGIGLLFTRSSSFQFFLLR